MSFGKFRPPLYLVLTLMAGAWDVELNPGTAATNNTVYPCGVCEEPVTWEQDAICCDACDTWNHKMCLQMSTTLRNHLANSDVSWICPQPLCNQPNYSAVLLK